MASNRIKNLVINVDEIYEKLSESIVDAIENISLDGLGDDGATNFEIENVTVEFKNGQFIANIDLQRIEGKFVSNQELEDEFLNILNGETMTVEVELNA